MHDVDGEIASGRMFLKLPLKLLTKLRFASDEQHANVMVSAREDRPLHFGPRGAVRTHRINCDYGWHPLEGDISLSGLFSLENFTALVVTAFGAGAVGHLLLVAVWALGE
jgi:hypothetical protein